MMLASAVHFEAPDPRGNQGKNNPLSFASISSAAMPLSKDFAGIRIGLDKEKKEAFGFRPFVFACDSCRLPHVITHHAMSEKVQLVFTHFWAIELRPVLSSSILITYNYHNIPRIPWGSPCQVRQMKGIESQLKWDMYREERSQTEEERREEAELGGFGCDFFLDDSYG
jgi:hypothetical protein